MNLRSAAVSLPIAAGILLLTGGLLFSQKETFSENENRYLAEFPAFSASSVTGGEFTAGLEDYVKDHFPFRNELMAFKSGTQIAAGYREINDVYIGKTRLLQKVALPDMSDFIDSVGYLADTVSPGGVTVSVMLVPSAAAIYPEELPDSTPLWDESALLDDIDSSLPETCLTVSLTEDFADAKAEGNLYYALDHHWTSFAAGLAHTAFCEARGISAPPLSAYTVEEVTDCFRGTLYSRVLTSRYPDDTIERYTLPGESFSAVYGKDAEEKPFYTESHLETKDKYAYFGDENHDLVVLTNEDAESHDEIVVVKDSYANCFVPFLTHHFRRVHVIDPRYYRRAISEYIAEQPAVTDLLVLYGINSLNDNSGIRTIG